MSESVEKTEGIDSAGPEKKKRLRDIFRGFIESIIDEKGMEVSHGIAMTKDGGIEIVVMMCDPGRCYEWLLCTIASRQDIVEVMIGIDRYTKPGQGNEFADVIGGVHWRRVGQMKGIMRPFIIDYKFGPPKVVRDVSYRNSFWNQVLEQEHKSAVLSIRRKFAEQRSGMN